MVSSVLSAGLTTVYQHLTAFAGLESFWTNFDSIFGTQYNIAVAQSLRSQWQSGNFSQLPTIEVIDDQILGNARGAYASSTNVIYLSDQFVETASYQQLEAVILEEIGHFVDAQVNSTDTAGDEGELFSALVRGVDLSAAELSQIKAEDDHAAIVVDGETVAVEQSITQVGKWDYLSYANAVAVVSNYAYVVGDTLEIIDISNPSNPVFKSSYDIAYGQDIQIVGNYAYVADGSLGLQIINISNPSAPTLAGSYDTPNHAYGVQIVGNYAYVADSSSGLKIINISNPSAPTLAGSYDTYYAHGVQVVGNYAYIADSSSGLKIVNISNPSAPTLYGSYNTYYTEGVEVVGKYAYVADGNSGLTILNISNPAAPTLAGSYSTSGFAQGVQVTGNYAYIADGDSGLQIINISNPSAPTFAGFYDTTGSAYGVQVAGNYAYVADGESGLQIINISSPSAPTLSGSYAATGIAYGVQVVGNYAYVADFFSGLQIINISNPSAPTLAGSYDATDWAFGVQVVGNYAYVADGGSGLQIINISNPSTPILAGSYDTDIIVALGVQVVGNYAYVAGGNSGLQIINIGNPLAPTLAGAYDTSNYAQGVQVAGNYAYIADGESGLQIINISNPSAPTFVGSYDTSSSAYGVQVVGNYAYVADILSGLQIINISNPSAPTLAGSYDTYAYGVQVVGNYAYVADWYTGLQIINISNPSAPSLADFYDTSGYARGVQVVGNYAYVADDEGGLKILNVIDFTGSSTSLSIAATNGNQTEGNSGSKAFTFTITRTGNTTVTNTVNWSITGTGTNPANGTDFVGNVLPSGTVTFGVNETSKLITVQINGDTATEANESFTVAIFNPSNGAAISTATATGTIQNDDTAQITLTLSPNSVTEDGTPNLVYTFTRTGTITNALTVNFSVNGTATFNNDYSQTGAATFTTATGTITFVAGSTTATLTVNPTADTTVESNETVALTLTPGTGYTLGTTTAVTGTITNDDLPSITLAVVPVNVLEDGTTNLVYTFTRTGPTTNALTVNYSIAGTANSSDYTGATPGTGKTITFAAGSATATLTVDPTADTTVESNETVALTLATGTGYTVGTTTAVTGTITNDDSTPNPFSPISGYGFVSASGAVAKAINQSPFPEIPVYGGVNDWNVNMVDAPEAWAKGYTGSGIVVAVVDTGVDRNHLELSSNIWTNSDEIANDGIDNDNNGFIDDFYGWNFVDNSNNTLDVYGHGTHVSGTIAGLKNNVGVTGIAYDAKIMPVKVLSDSGSGSYWGVAQGIRYAVDNGAKVINMSLGGPSPDTGLQQAVKYASDHGVIVVMAAGNNSESQPIYPGYYALEHGLVVGAVDSSNEMAYFSNQAGSNSSMAYVTAPGVSVYSSLPNGQYASWSGTSMATPHVAGVVALMLSANPNLSDAQVRNIITSTTETDPTLTNFPINPNTYLDTNLGIVQGLLVVGDANNNALVGGAGDDTLQGLAGNDILDGKTGADQLQGGSGNDTYVVDSVGDAVTETSTLSTEIDTVQSSVTYTLGANLENLTLTGNAAINGTGNSLNNSLTGNNFNNTLNGGDGNDTLNGSTGVDTLIGGLGNDVYQVDSTTDVITENSGQGTDTIQSSVTYTIASLANIENLTLTGSSVITATGNTANNSLTGNTVNNTLNGGDGNDTLNGGAGNDSLIGGNGNDFAYYYSSTASVTVNLTTGTASDGLGGTDTLSFIENVQGSNTASDNLTGNTGVNILYGYGGADILTGGGGNDLLYLGSDTVKDTVNYTSGDGADTVYNFVRGASGDLLKFTGITAIDVQVSGTNTLFKVGDGISGNTGFGSGTLLLTTSATTGFNATDIGVNLFNVTNSAGFFFS
jgi:subtilisin family serine protease